MLLMKFISTLKVDGSARPGQETGQGGADAAGGTGDHDHGRIRDGHACGARVQESNFD